MRIERRIRSTVTPRAATEPQSSAGRALKSCRQLEHEKHAGQRRAHRAAHHGRHADHRPETGVTDREPLPDECAQRAADDQQRRQHAARSARAKRDRPDQPLCRRSRTRSLRTEDLPLQQAIDQVIADPEHARIEPPPTPTKTRADRRPPHPVDRQLQKNVFAEVDQHRQQTRAETRRGCRSRLAQRIADRPECRMRRDGKDRTCAEQRHAQQRRHDRGHRDRE